MDEPSRTGKRQLDEKVWATTSARLLKLSPPKAAEALQALGIDPEIFAAWDRHWGRELAAELERGERRLADLYAASCAEEMRRRAAPPAPEVAPPPPPKAAAPAGKQEVYGREDEHGPLSLRRPQVGGPTLDEYAWFVAEVIVTPARQGEVMARHGLSDVEAQKRVDQSFHSWFESQPDARDEWIALCAAHQEEIRRRGR